MRRARCACSLALHRRWVACVANKHQNDYNLTANQWFAVGVQGFRASLYTIMLTFAGNETQLVNGIPVSGAVANDKYVYYTYVPTDVTTPFSVVLTRQSGDPDLVINNSPTLPTINTAVYKELAYGNDIITITPQASDTVFTIGVYGTGNSQYTIVVTQNATVILADGVPQVCFPLLSCAFLFCAGDCPGECSVKVYVADEWALYRDERNWVSVVPRLTRCRTSSGTTRCSHWVTSPGPSPSPCP